MNGLREKFRNKKGFTLIEMLIVVAIIAILVAVSIPLVGSALDKAREATDAANERAFKAELVASYMLNGAGMGDNAVEVKDDGTKYAYDAANGAISETGVTSGYGQTTERKGMILWATIDKTGKITMGWSAAGASAPATIADNCVTSTVIKTEATP